MREEEKKRTSLKTNFFRKRWVFPAIYLLSAAIILTGVLWFQSSNDDVADSDDYAYDGQDTAQTDEPSVPVNRPVENFAMPVLDEDAVEVKRQFYNVDASAEEQEAALVFYDNTYFENKGIDIVAKDGEAFEVTASLGGNVVKSEKDSLFGNVVEIEHEDGVVTVYQSLADVQVKQGDYVEQGQVIASAGKNVYDEESGIHVHFEIRKNGTAVNPIDFFGKPLTSLEENEDASKEQPAEEEKAPANEEDKAPANEDGNVDGDEKAPADDDSSEDKEKEGTEDSDSTDTEVNTPEATDASISQARA